MFEGPDITRQLTDALEASSFRRAADVLERCWGHLLRTEPALFHRAMAALPSAVLDDYPALRLLRNPDTWAERRDVRDDDALERALAQIEAGSGDDHLQLSRGMVVLGAMRRNGDYADGARLGDRLATVIARADPQNAADLIRIGYVRLHTGLAKLLAGDVTGAAEAFTRAYQVRAPWGNLRTDAAGKLSLLYALTGEFPQAEGWIDRGLEAEADCEDWMMRSTERVALLCARGQLALDRLDWATFDEQQARLDRERISTTEDWAFVLHLRARAAVLRGGEHAVLDQLRGYRDRWPHRLRPGQTQAVLLDSAEAALLIALGEMREAERVVGRLTSTHPYEVIATARFLMETGRADTAAKITDPANWQLGLSPRARVTLLLQHLGAQVRLQATKEQLQPVLRHATGLLAPMINSWRYTLAAADPEVLDELADHSDIVAGALHGPTGGVPAAGSDSEPAPEMSRREMQILHFLAHGLTVPQMGQKLYLAPGTIKNHRKRIYRKLGASSRAEAISAALKSGLLSRRELRRPVDA